MPLCLQLVQMFSCLTIHCQLSFFSLSCLTTFFKRDSNWLKGNAGFLRRQKLCCMMSKFWKMEWCTGILKWQILLMYRNIVIHFCILNRRRYLVWFDIIPHTIASLTQTNSIGYRDCLCSWTHCLLIWSFVVHIQTRQTMALCIPSCVYPCEVECQHFVARSAKFWQLQVISLNICVWHLNMMGAYSAQDSEVAFTSTVIQDTRNVCEKGNLLKRVEKEKAMCVSFSNIFRIFCLTPNLALHSLVP